MVTIRKENFIFILFTTMRISVLIIGLILLLVSCAPKKTILPFHYERNLYIQCKVNEKVKGSFMFDTGAYGLYLDSLYNQNSGLHLQQTLGTISIPGVEPYHFPDPPPVTFACGDIQMEYKQMTIIQTKASFGKICDGIVGWDLFTDKVLHVDYLAKQLTVQKASGFVPDTSFTAIPLQFHDNRFYLPLRVALSAACVVQGNFLLDLGFGGSVYLTGDTYRNYRLDTLKNKKLEFTMDWATLHKQRTVAYISKCRSIQINKWSLENPSYECALDTSGVLGGGDYVGLLGNRALERFDVYIDLAKHVLYLKPNIDYKKEMLIRTMGFGFSDRTDICEGLVVRALDVEGEAIRQGLRPGDIVTHINNKAINTDTENQIKQLYAQTGQSHSIKFRRRDSVFTLKLDMKLWKD